MSHCVAILAVPNVQMLDVCGPIDVFAEANRILKRTFYTLRVLSVCGSVIESSSGVRISADASLTDCNPLLADTFIIAGAPGIRDYQPDANVLVGINALCESSVRYGSVCTGALLLAMTGRLSGKRVTTHWACADILSDKYPEITVEANSLYVADGNIRTAAGVTSGLDMALRLIEEDLGRSVAAEVADQLVMFLKRPVGQSHFIRSNTLSLNGRTVFQDLQRWVIANIKDVTTVTMMAAHINLSTRHLSRLFKQETRLTPADWLQRERVAKAKLLIEKDNLPAKKLADECGFSGPDVMRRVFFRITGITPSDYRKMMRRE